MRNTVGLFLCQNIGVFSLDESKEKELKLKDIEKYFYVDEKYSVEDIDYIKFYSEKPTPASREMKKPYSIEEMIEKLKVNNMTFTHEEEVECIDFLKQVNYYTFKFYANDLFGKNSEKSFTAVKEVYFFDHFLRGWLHDLVSRLEMFLRSAIVDTIAQNYKSDTFQASQFYIDESIYFEEVGKRSKNKRDRVIMVNKLYENFYKTIQDNKKRHEAIQHHEESYGATPVWLLFDLMTLGSLSTFYSLLIPRYKNLVAKNITKDSENNRIPGDLLASWLDSLRHLRNVVSHTGKIYGTNFHLIPKEHENDKGYIQDLKKFSYDKRLIIHLLAMKRLFLLMPKDSQLMWNSKIEELYSESVKSDYILLTRLGVIDRTKEYLLI